MNDKNIFYAIGDLHGNAKFLLEALEKIANETKNSANLNVFIFFVGDFGFIFNGSEKEKNKKQVILNRYNFNYIVILGNHENYSLIYKLKVINRYNANVYLDNEVNNLIYVINGETLTIRDKNFWCYGGGVSVDQARREVHDMLYNEKTWWEEEIDESNFEKGIHNFKNKKIDVILTHDVPLNIFNKLVYLYDCTLNKRSSLQGYFDYIYYDLNGKDSLWIAGHFHPTKILKFDNLYILPIGKVFKLFND